MPRPCKRRRICAMPGAVCFAPKEQQHTAESISMTLDEYETIRLIDLLGQSQEACAESMGVARTTVQAIYGSARSKLARAICQGMELRIEGGNYYLCKGGSQGCQCPRCRKESTKGCFESCKKTCEEEKTDENCSNL